MGYTPIKLKQYVLLGDISLFSNVTTSNAPGTSPVFLQSNTTIVVLLYYNFIIVILGLEKCHYLLVEEGKVGYSQIKLKQYVLLDDISLLINLATSNAQERTPTHIKSDTTYIVHLYYNFIVVILGLEECACFWKTVRWGTVKLDSNNMYYLVTYPCLTTFEPIIFKVLNLPIFCPILPLNLLQYKQYLMLGDIFLLSNLASSNI